VDPSDPAAVRPRINPVQRLATLPEGWSGTNYVGEIKIDAAGRNVYVSNRGHDSVAAFKVDAATGLLERAGVDCVLGRCPRWGGLTRGVGRGGGRRPWGAPRLRGSRRGAIAPPLAARSPGRACCLVGSASAPCCAAWLARSPAALPPRCARLER
jgi:hypothetical protein